jgi:hypothetical protein
VQSLAVCSHYSAIHGPSVAQPTLIDTAHYSCYYTTVPIRVPSGPRLLTALDMQLRFPGRIRLTADTDSLFVHTPLGRFGFHSDLHNTECVREFDAPRRLYIQLGPLGSLIAGAPTQAWLPLRGWRHDRSAHLVWSPPRALLCPAPIDNTGSICAALIHHPGPHTTPYRPLPGTESLTPPPWLSQPRPLSPTASPSTPAPTHTPEAPPE